GAVYVWMKTAEALGERARRAGIAASLLTCALFAAGGVWLYLGIRGYAITGAIDHAGPSNPLRKTVQVATGAWFDTYRAHPWTVLAPILGLAGPLLTAWLLTRRKPLGAFLASAVGLLGIIATPRLPLFPFLLPSSG